MQLRYLIDTGYSSAQDDGIQVFWYNQSTTQPWARVSRDGKLRRAQAAFHENVPLRAHSPVSTSAQPPTIIQQVKKETPPPACQYRHVHRCPPRIQMPSGLKRASPSTARSCKYGSRESPRGTRGPHLLADLLRAVNRIALSRCCRVRQHQH